MFCPNKMEVILAMSVMSVLWNMISADTNSKSHFSSGELSSSSRSPVSHSFSSFGSHNSDERSASSSRGGHNHNGDKLTTRDTTGSSSYTPGSSLPQQPDPSIALLPRGDQQSSIFSKEGEQGSSFSGSSSSGFGSSPLGYQQGFQIAGFPQGSFGGFSYSPAPSSSSSSSSASQDGSSGRNTQAGQSLARFPQTFPLGGLTHQFGNPLGFTQGFTYGGFPQGITLGGFPQGATFGTFAPGATFGGFGHGAALSPVPGYPAGAPLAGSQQQGAPARGQTPYQFASPVGYSQIYRQPSSAQSYSTGR